MNRQKLVTPYLLGMTVLTVLITLIGIWRPAVAKSRVYRLHKSETIGLGTQGLYVTNFPGGVSQVYLDTVGAGALARFSHKFDLKFRAPAMEVRFLDERGREVESISAQVYVYFNIGRAERDLWLKGGMEEIAIWYASVRTGGWKTCRTFLINEPGRDGTVGRLACLAPGSGYYALERRVLDKQPASINPTATPGLPPYPPPYGDPTATPIIPPYPAPTRDPTATPHLP